MPRGAGGRHLPAIQDVLGVTADGDLNGESDVSLQSVRLPGPVVLAGIVAGEAPWRTWAETVVIANGDEGDPGSKVS